GLNLPPFQVGGHLTIMESMVEGGAKDAPCPVGGRPPCPSRVVVGNLPVVLRLALLGPYAGRCLHQIIAPLPQLVGCKGSNLGVSEFRPDECLVAVLCIADRMLAAAVIPEKPEIGLHC